MFLWNKFALLLFWDWFGCIGADYNYGNSWPGQEVSNGFCWYGARMECCWGWTRTSWGLCQPLCQLECKHGFCVGPDKCKCHPGYTGKTCNQDVNECGLKPRPCKHRCMNTHGSYKCYCLNGYMLQPDGICRNARTCSMANCQYGCEVSKGEVQCQCPSPGLRLGPDRRTCVDIDECMMGRGVCPQNRKCKNTFGSYVCKCYHGYKLTYINGKYQCIDKDSRPFCALNPDSPRCHCRGEGKDCHPVAMVTIEPPPIEAPKTTTKPTVQTSPRTKSKPTPKTTPKQTTRFTSKPTPRLTTITTFKDTTTTTTTRPITMITIATTNTIPKTIPKTTTTTQPPTTTTTTTTVAMTTITPVTTISTTPVPTTTVTAETTTPVPMTTTTPETTTPVAMTTATPKTTTNTPAVAKTTTFPTTFTTITTIPTINAMMTTIPTTVATTTTTPTTVATTSTIRTTVATMTTVKKSVPTTRATTIPSSTTDVPSPTTNDPSPTTTLDNHIQKEVTQRPRGDVFIPRHPEENHVFEFEIELGNTAEENQDDPGAGSLSCSFDHGLCGWIRNTDGDLHWEMSSHPAGGRYLSVPELGAGKHSIRGARLVLPLSSPWSEGHLCFSFRHWLSGHHVGVLQLFIRRNGRGLRYSPALWSRTTGGGWRLTQVTLGVGLESILLRGERRRGHRGDIGLDDFSLRRGSCSDERLNTHKLQL